MPPWCRPTGTVRATQRAWRAALGLTRAAARPAWLHRISDVAPSSPNAAAVYKHPVYELPWDTGKDELVRAAACSCPV
jgi:hypothetical protein